MIKDTFETVTDSLISPARRAFAVAPNDSSEFEFATKAFYVGTGGDVTLRAIGDDADVTFRNIAGGTILAIRARAIRATGTTASDIVGLA